MFSSQCGAFTWGTCAQCNENIPDCCGAEHACTPAAAHACVRLPVTWPRRQALWAIREIAVHPDSHAVLAALHAGPLIVAAMGRHAASAEVVRGCVFVPAWPRRRLHVQRVAGLCMLVPHARAVCALD